MKGKRFAVKQSGLVILTCSGGELWKMLSVDWGFNMHVECWVTFLRWSERQVC